MTEANPLAGCRRIVAKPLELALPLTVPSSNSPEFRDSCLRREVTEVGDSAATELGVERFGGNIIRSRLLTR